MIESASTTEDFARQVEPSLEAMARYAARRVGPTARDQVVEDALVRAWQGRSAYDESRVSWTAWLLRLTEAACRRPRGGPRDGSVVELVDDTAAPQPASDRAMEMALDQLDERERELVDWRYFVGLDVATLAEVVRVQPAEVTAGLRRARTTLCRQTGEPGDERMDRRLSVLAVRWQQEQPPPPGVPVDSLDRRLKTRARPRTLLAAGAAALLVGIGVVAVVRAGADGTPAASGQPSASAPPSPGQGIGPAPAPPSRAQQADHIVPWRDLEPGNPTYDLDQNGSPVTPYDQVVATGAISGRLRPGDTLVFDAGLTSPGVVSLRPCPDFTVTIGTHSFTGRLNCKQDPYYASSVRSNGEVTQFRPVLPAGVTVFFRMAVLVPDDPGRQRVLWALNGPLKKPAFDGTVQVSD